MAKIHNLIGGKPAVKKAATLTQRLPELKGMDIKDFFDKYNLLGYDNGDGELACSRVFYDGNSLQTEPLRFHKAAPVYHVPNILAFQKDKARLVDEHHIGSQSNLFINFKRCPGIAANNRYENSNYTYAQLMGHSFACAVKVLAECNVSFRTDKPTIILVGRPSSKGWEDAEAEYEAILSKYLKEYLPDCWKNITILVLSESLAAMAGALKMDQEKWLQAFIQILDLGSSTFDLTTITPKGLHREGEDSFQFGGNQLDKAMTGYGDYLYFKKFPKEKGYTLPADHRKTAALRFKKELCYGDNGSHLGDLALQKQNAYSYYVYKTGSTQPEIDEDTEDPLQAAFPVTANSMTRILNNQIGKDGSEQLKDLHCKTERLSGNGLHTTKEHESWLTGCRYVLQQFRDKTKGLYPAGSHLNRRLILTGGVSNMPEVRKIAEEVFGVKAELADSPSQTVSNGLALILGSEILKKALLAQVEKTILAKKSPVPGPETLLEELISAAAEEDLDFYEAVIRNWAEGDGTKTLKECYDAFLDDDFALIAMGGKFAETACRNWFQKHSIDRKVEKVLADTFRQMFPKFTRELHSSIRMPDMSDIPVKELENIFSLNPYMFYNEENCPSNPMDKSEPLTTAQRQAILKVYRQHRDGLKNGAFLDYKNGYSVRIEPAVSLDSPPVGKGKQDRTATIRSIYALQLSEKEDAVPIRQRLLESIIPQIRDYIEELTYYLAVSKGT